MAATDQTFRNQKTLNIVFGLTSLVMFLTVIVMMVQDYNREFKPIQRKFRDVEVGVNERLMLDQLPERAEVDKRVDAVVAARKALADAKQQVRSKESELTAKREKLDNAYRMKKAEFDSKMSYIDIWTEKVNKAEAQGERAKLEKELAARRDDVEKSGGVRDQLAKARAELDAAEKEYKVEVRSKVEGPEKALGDAEDSLKRLTGVFDRFAKTTAQKRWGFGDTFREMPIIDGFASPVKIQQVKLNDLTIDYGGFRDVPRFDRCMTCHLGIDRPTFDRASLEALGGDPKDLADKLAKAHEIFAKRVKDGEDLGFDPNDIPKKPSLLKLTKGEITQYMAHPRLDLFVDPNSPHPMQKFGCTICHGGQGSSTEYILASHTPNDGEQKKEWQKNYEWESVHFWDYPMNPTRFQEASCVKCHYDMTDLIRNGVKEEAPKLLKGFNLVRENGCFGCHEITGAKGGRQVGPDLRLEPAPALEWLSVSEQERVKGENPGAMRKVGPSLRRIAEKTNETWTRKWIQSPRGFREDTKMPHFYGLSTNKQEYLSTNAAAQKDFPEAEIHSIAYYLFAESKQHLEGKDTTREYLKRTIRDLQKKLETGPLSVKEQKDLSDMCRGFGNLALLSVPYRANAINDQLARQKQLQDRLQELYKQDAKDQTKAVFDSLNAVTAELEKTALAVPIATEIVDADHNPVSTAELTKADDAHLVNGRRLFTEKGCLACHAHDATTKRDETNKFPELESHANFGPNLSRLAAKLGDGANDATKKRWLVQWILNPNIHHPRTRMPVTFLSPAEANDVAEWLLNQKSDYDGADPAAPPKETLVALARVYLGKAKDLTQEDVDTILPASGEVNADKSEALLKRYLSKDPANDPNGEKSDADEQSLHNLMRDGQLDQNKLRWYIGKKSIGRLGCYGCHDLPGFENSKPIGTALNDWGKKDPERLAFEDVDAFVKQHFNITPLRDPAKQLEINNKIKERQEKIDRWTKDDEEKYKAEIDKANGELKPLLKEAEEMRWVPNKDGKQPYDEYFFESLEHHGRNGFLYQKLIEPRSYDFGRIRAWDDRLRMPQFQFARVRKHKDETDEQFAERKLIEEAEAREAVMTFILGLVAEAVPLKYVNSPAPDRLAEVKGRQVLDKFNCSGCHQVQPGRYEFKKSKPAIKKLQGDWDEVSNKVLADHYFPNHNAWAGKPSPFADRFVAFGVQPQRGEEGLLAIRLAEALRFTGADGSTHDIPQSAGINILESELTDRDDPYGGTFVDLLVGRRTNRRNDGPFRNEPVGYLAYQYDIFNDKPDDARSALPPPLFREGERVQPRWLFQFLLNPQPVRPQHHMRLRMPRFNMSSDEAMALANYFGAASKLSNPDDNLTIPYLKIEQRESGYWRQKAREYVAQLEAKKELEPRLKAMEPVWKEQLQQEKSDLDAGREALKKAIDAEKVPDAKTQKQQELTALEANLAKVTEQLTKNDLSALIKRWKEEDAYAYDSYRLLTNKGLCIQCHTVGKLENPAGVGPNLNLSAERLRPDWTVHWISNPNRMFTYSTQMPQPFPTDKIEYQEAFRGSQIDQVKAVRDALMDLPRLADLPANRPPRWTPTGGGK
jgi:mono/diheme cytochrome c family protein